MLETEGLRKISFMDLFLVFPVGLTVFQIVFEHCDHFCVRLGVKCFSSGEIDIAWLSTQLSETVVEYALEKRGPSSQANADTRTGHVSE